MSVLKIKPTLNGNGESGGAMYKHTVTLHCLNSCSSTSDIIVIFNSSKKEEYTEEEFRGLFTIHYPGDDSYLLNIVNTVIVTGFNSLEADILSYKQSEDVFKVRSKPFTFQSFEDVVTTI